LTIKNKRVSLSYRLAKIKPIRKMKIEKNKRYDFRISFFDKEGEFLDSIIYERIVIKGAITRAYQQIQEYAGRTQLQSLMGLKGVTFTFEVKVEPTMENSLNVWRMWYPLKKAYKPVFSHYEVNFDL